MERVVVVGSGLAGLSAGHRLRERGWKVTVFESLDRVGGRVLSESQDGFVFDVGPVIVTDQCTEYMKLVRDVGLSDQVVDCASEMGVVKDRLNGKINWARIDLDDDAEDAAHYITPSERFRVAMARQ